MGLYQAHHIIDSAIFAFWHLGLPLICFPPSFVSFKADQPTAAHSCFSLRVSWQPRRLRH